MKKFHLEFHSCVIIAKEQKQQTMYCMLYLFIYVYSFCHFALLLLLPEKV